MGTETPGWMKGSWHAYYLMCLASNFDRVHMDKITDLSTKIWLNVEQRFWKRLRGRQKHNLIKTNLISTIWRFITLVYLNQVEFAISKSPRVLKIVQTKIFLTKLYFPAHFSALPCDFYDGFVLRDQTHFSFCSLKAPEFLAATKQLYEWFSPSLRPTARLSVTPFWLCSHHRIIMNFSGVITND